MSGLIHKLRHILKELNKFSFPAANKGEKNDSFHMEQFSDQLTHQALITLLEKTVGEKKGDFEISYAELVVLQNKAKNTFYNHTLQKLVNSELLECCNVALEQRNTLLINLLDFIYTCQIIPNISFIDSKKVNSKLLQICKELYKTEEVILFLHTTDVESLFTVLIKSACFSQALFFDQTAQQQTKHEEKLTEFQKARKIFTLHLDEGFTKLRSRSYPPFASSAPTSPFIKEVSTPKLYSLPTSPKSPFDNEVEGDLSDQEAKGREILSSTSVFHLPNNPANRGRRTSVVSTSSTLLPPEQLSDEFFKLTLGASSKSQDESDEKKINQKEEKERKVEKEEKLTSSTFHRRSSKKK